MYLIATSYLYAPSIYRNTGAPVPDPPWANDDDDDDDEDEEDENAEWD